MVNHNRSSWNNRITLIASDESTAPLYRVRILAKVLALRYEVETLGFHFGDVDPCAPRDFPYQALEARDFPAFFGDAKRLRSLVRGDVVYAMKPRPTSFGLALWCRKSLGLKVAVDVDDDELSMIDPFSRYPLKNLLYSFASPGTLSSPNAFPYTWALEPFVRRADAVTVVSTRFQKRYGGTLAPQWVDTERFDPERCRRDSVRREEGLGGERAIAFVGIAQPNKGLEEISVALDRLENWKLWIVGPLTPCALSLAARDERVVLFGTRPPEQAPRFLAAADLVVLPQRSGRCSDGQMPIKLFEAMAMGKPIVATALADIPQVLEGCGVVVPPGDPGRLAAAVASLASDASLSGTLGAAARRRCVERFSWKQGIETLSGVLDPIMRGGRE